jgi:DNA repair ATPase RecN
MLQMEATMPIKEHKAAITNIMNEINDVKSHFQGGVDEATTKLDNVTELLQSFRDELEKEAEDLSEEEEKESEIKDLIDGIDTAIDYINDLKEKLEEDYFNELMGHLYDLNK